MPLTVTDSLFNLNGQPLLSPYSSALVTLKYSVRDPLLLQSGVYRIGATETREGISVRPGDDGSFTLVIFRPSEMLPSVYVSAFITIPDGNTADGTTYSGTVPELDGPLTISDLINDHGWGVVPAFNEPVLAIQGATGPGITWLFDWDSSVIYHRYNAVYDPLSGSSFVAKGDTTVGLRPADGPEWGYLAHGITGAVPPSRTSLGLFGLWV